MQKSIYFCKMYLIVSRALIVFVSVTSFLSYCVGNLATKTNNAQSYSHTPPLPIRFIRFFNNTGNPVVAHYLTRADGFEGPHATMPMDIALEPATWHMIKIVANPDHTAPCTFTQDEKTLTELVQAHNNRMILSLTPNGTLAVEPAEAPEARVFI
jgi:hypothetical protein